MIHGTPKVYFCRKHRRHSEIRVFEHSGGLYHTSVCRECLDRLRESYRKSTNRPKNPPLFHGLKERNHVPANQPLA